jgi:Domain of unknown function (DUF4260)
MAMYRSLVNESATPPVRSIGPDVTLWLRLEGLAGFGAGIVLFGQLGGAWLLLVPALLLVDVSMAGYLHSPRAGAFTYNLAHQWATGLVVLGAGLAAGIPLLSLAGAVLIAHVGMDRVAGYGLKQPTDFHDTHLGRIGAR